MHGFDIGLARTTRKELGHLAAGREEGILSQYIVRSARRFQSVLASEYQVAVLIHNVFDTTFEF
jgi:hypothetical protein